MGKHFDMLDIWQQKADNVTGKALDSGHFFAEEAASETLENLLNFF